MDRAEPKSLAGGKRRSPPRADVQALIALLALDEDIRKREASVAQTLALAEGATSELARLEPAVGAAREELRRRAEAGEDGADIERLRRALLDDERHVAQVMRRAEKKQAEVAAASAALRDACADAAGRRGAIIGRIPQQALKVYESALQRGLLPPAVATRGAVCWGCFHRLSGMPVAPFLSEEAFVCCPHCERLLFNPEWTERR
jgi:predicted  nucleic acid-binding Zn-ribbon protein